MTHNNLLLNSEPITTQLSDNLKAVWQQFAQNGDFRQQLFTDMDSALEQAGLVCTFAEKETLRSYTTTVPMYVDSTMTTKVNCNWVETQ